MVRFNYLRLRAIREQYGLTQEEFGASIGSSRGLVDSVERGLSKPRTAMVEVVCNKYNVDPNFLFTWSDVDNIGDEQ